MRVVSMLALLFTHPLEFRTLVQYHLWHEQRDVSAPHERENSGWDRENMRRCWYFLDMTSRSFAAVIKQLEDDLARVVCLYYLVLRGLDTIEDDMTLPDEKKQKILRSFHELTLQRGWNFTESGPEEADRELLVEYDKVVEELHLLPPKYRDVIIEVTKKMETGMADYAHRAATTGSIYLEKIEEWDLYCHYVAGLVGEGVSGLFSASGKESPLLATQLELSNSMGLFLQKTNIIRDYREDVEAHRYFWPREIWGADRFGKACGGRPGFKEMKEMYEPENLKQAQWVQSALILDALRHATDSLDYLRLLRNQSVFNFCAIPQSMAIATLALCFMNPNMFQRNVKIRKAEAADLIMRSTNPRDVAYIFREYARRIHHKSNPEDPSFVQIAIACGKIEQWCEFHYPSFVRMISSSSGTSATQQFNPYDVRTKVVLASEERDREFWLQKRLAEKAGNGTVAAGTNGRAIQAGQGKDDGSSFELVLYVGLFMAALGALMIGGVYLLTWYLDTHA